MRHVLFVDINCLSASKLISQYFHKTTYFLFAGITSAIGNDET